MWNEIFLNVALVNWLMAVVVLVPLWLGIRSIRRLVHVEPIEREREPKVSVIVPARNEERNIETALTSLLNLDYDRLDVTVVNDRSTDRTGEILDRLASEYPQLNVVHLSTLPDGWIGKNHALHYGAMQRDADLLLFTDADVVMDPSALRRAVRYMIDHDIDHLPMFFRVEMPNWLLESFVVTFCIYFFTYFRPWRARDPNSSAHVGVGGFNLIRADVYRQIGTYQAIRMRPDDDVKLGKLVKSHGFRQEILLAGDLMYVPWYSSLRELVHGLEKNAFSGSDYSIFLTTISSISIIVFNVFPFLAVWLTTGWTQAVYAAVVPTLLAIPAVIAHYGKARMSCCLGMPIAALIFAYIQWRTMILNIAGGGIRWRDTHYSLKELKANNI